MMNMHDLSRDDDFLSHLLVEKLGTRGFPLLVHKMDSTRRLPKTNVDDLMLIVKRVRLHSLSFSWSSSVQRVFFHPTRATVGVR